MVAATVSKSDAIREILKGKPSASVRDVQAVLKQKGVKASTALINKIKYDRKRSASKIDRRKNGASKADAIRQAWHELGRTARPRDVIAHLSERGMKVTSAQVSMLRNNNGHASVASVVPFEHLLAAKQFVERIGSVDAARHAVDCLSKLL